MATRLRRYEFSERLADILGASRRDLRLRVTLLITGGLFPPGPRGPGVATGDARLRRRSAHRGDGSTPAGPDRRCRALLPRSAADHRGARSGHARHRPRRRRASAAPRTERSEALPLLPRTLRFGQVLAQLLDQARRGRDAGSPGTRAVRHLGQPRLSGRCRPARHLGRRPARHRQPAVRAARGRAAAGLARSRPGRRRRSRSVPQRVPAGQQADRDRHADRPERRSERRPDSRSAEKESSRARTDDRPSRQPGPRPAPQAPVGEVRRQGRARRRPRPRRSMPGSSRLAEVTGFGSNPGNLRMMTYVPVGLPEGAPLVVVLHGCTQTAASFDYGTGWSTMADRYGFAVLLPEQGRSNNPLRCFNWFKGEDVERDSGEALSIRQMVARMVADHGIDPAARLRHRPVGRRGDDLGDAGNLSRGLRRRRHRRRRALPLRQRPAGRLRGHLPGAEPSAARVGRSGARRLDACRAVAEGVGLARRCRQHGEADQRRRDHQAVDGRPRPDRCSRRRRRSTGSSAGSGATRTARCWSKPSPSPAWPTASPSIPPAEDGCGATAPFILDVGISSTHHIAGFWGLTEKRWERPAAAARGGANGSCECDGSGGAAGR